MKNTKNLRTLTALAFILLITIGFITHLGIGTMSAPGFMDISLLCPLGALGTMIASKTLLPRGLVSIVLFVILAIVLARAFCGWICPVPLVSKIRNIFTKTKASDVKPLSDEEKSLLKGCSTCGDTTGCNACGKLRGNKLDARHFILGGALVSTAAFGFPVFCLICPIGLSFATILLVINLFAHGDVTWSLLIVPAILILEVVVFKKWCHNLCPLSALMSLLGKANKTFVPNVDKSKCLETTKGAHCNLCSKACPEGIDLRGPEFSQAALSECIKCRSCVDACPTHAITMPFLPAKKAELVTTESSDGSDL